MARPSMTPQQFDQQEQHAKALAAGAPALTPDEAATVARFEHTPAALPTHSMTVTVHHGHVELRPVCHALEGALCRLVGGDDCQCEAWAGPHHDLDTGDVYHLAGSYDLEADERVEVRHVMRDGGECQVLLFLTADPDLLPELFHGPGGELATAPIDVEWDGDSYLWQLPATTGALGGQQ